MRMPSRARTRLTRIGEPSVRTPTSTPRSEAYDTSRRSPGFSGSINPSPANALSSTIAMVPPSSVSPLALVSHTARSGRPLPDERSHSDTRSASISVLTIGTSAD